MPTKLTLTRASAAQLLPLLLEAEWRLTARLNQLTPKGSWRIWLILAGRGWGKTRTGAQDVARYGLAHSGSRIAIVAPTFADARDTCVEGESGLLTILGSSVATWNRSYGELILKNGTRYKLFSADEPERLRGPQHHRAWCDELAAWTKAEAFDQLAFGLRLGDDPRIVATTTPRPTRFLQQLLQRADVHVTRGSTYDNAAHLPASTLTLFEQRYRGTRLGRQELEAEILDDAAQALFNREALDRHRVSTIPALSRVLVALDPAVTSGAQSDLTGIVCAGVDAHGHAYLLADASGRHPPERWGSIVRALATTYGATQVVGEVNQGGDLIARMLSLSQTEGPRLAYKPLRAAKGKVSRAIPVAALYEQGRVHHVGGFAALEDQLCRMTLQGYEAADDSKSPDRLDALVWALTELLLQPTGAPGLTIL